MYVYPLSKKIVSNDTYSGTFAYAYNFSYTDIYDFSSVEQSLKKFEIDLGIHHNELGLPWDKPVPEELWERVAEYCCFDVAATEAVFIDRKADFDARCIIAALSGLSVNDKTTKHTAKIIFRNDPHPQDKFVYTDLSTIFPGYVFTNGKSFYKGEEIGEGGLVRAKPGFYTNVGLFDVMSMHPHSLYKLNAFGEYTGRFYDLVLGRIAVKHRDFKALETILSGDLLPYCVGKSEEELDNLAYALKIVINIVYGMTSAKFENPFKDPRNVDNIVAKYGALFMCVLNEELEARGVNGVHTKNDSVKVANATKDDWDFIYNFGLKYGFTFEYEADDENVCTIHHPVCVAK